MTVVVDASVLVAALTDDGPDGRWAETLLTVHLAAPPLLHVEVANVLRRSVAAAEITDDIASIAHADLMDLRVQLVSYESVAERVWSLRHNVTPYDAWYVAVAEALGAPLATLDMKLAGAPGPRCQFETPTAPNGARADSSSPTAGVLGSRRATGRVRRRGLAQGVTEVSRRLGGDRGRRRRHSVSSGARLGRR